MVATLIVDDTEITLLLSRAHFPTSEGWKTEIGKFAHGMHPPPPASSFGVVVKFLEK